MRSTKVLLAFSSAACLFGLGVVLWVYLFPDRLPPFLVAAVDILGVVCTILACFKEGTARFSLRKSTPLFMGVLVVISFLFAWCGMFLNAGPDIYQGDDGLYYYKSRLMDRAALPQAEVDRLERGRYRVWAGMGQMFITFPTAYFSGVLREEQGK